MHVHVEAAPGSWWEQLLDLDGVAIRQKELRLDLVGSRKELLDLDGVSIRQKELRLDRDGSRKEVLDLDESRKEVLDLDKARNERPAVRDKHVGQTRGHARGHARGHRLHAEL